MSDESGVSDHAPVRIAVIHATRVAVPPVEAAFARLWPEADRLNLLHESLSRDLAEAGGLTPALFDRVDRLARRGKDSGAHGILFSCSAFGAAIEAARARMDIPVLKPNEAMLEEALDAGSKILLAATFAPSLDSIREELDEMAAERGREIEVEGCLVSGALDALHAGEPEAHDALIAEAIAGRPPCGVVLLAQFSMARALPAVAGKVEARVLSSPDSAVARLREQLAGVRSAPSAR
ncbi:MAG: aspartate/glutamate racemase family protein [bacterium]